jgi:hypothetical protein
MPTWLFLRILKVLATYYHSDDLIASADNGQWKSRWPSEYKQGALGAPPAGSRGRRIVFVATRFKWKSKTTWGRHVRMVLQALGEAYIQDFLLGRRVSVVADDSLRLECTNYSAGRRKPQTITNCGLLVSRHHETHNHACNYHRR